MCKTFKYDDYKLKVIWKNFLHYIKSIFQGLKVNLTKVVSNFELESLLWNKVAFGIPKWNLQRNENMLQKYDFIIKNM